MPSESETSGGHAGTDGDAAFVTHASVRLKGDPTRIGVLTGRTRPNPRPDRGPMRQIRFPDTTQWVPSDQIDVMPSAPESPLDLLESGLLGRASDLRRALTHVRLNGRLADVIYSMEMTNTDFYAYQFKPVLRFLNSPSNALLIADEVGLGKTIEAGLVWTELRSRMDLRRLLVLCPAMLREKWQRELKGKFGIQAEIVNACELHRRLEEPLSYADGFSLIASLEGTRPPRGWEDLAEDSGAKLAGLLQSKESDQALVDLLVIDEAHYLRNPESQTNELGHLFRRVSEHLLLLTATPIHNYNRDLHSLLNLLDADTFRNPEDLGRVLEVSRPLVRARDNILSAAPSRETVEEALRAAAATPLLLRSRQLAALLDELPDLDLHQDRAARAEFARRIELVNPTAYVITRTRKRDVKEWRVVREPKLESVPMTVAESNFYNAVTDAVIDYAADKGMSDQFILSTPQRQMSSSMAATMRAWQQRRQNWDETQMAGSDGRAEEPPGPLVQSIISQLDDFGSLEDLLAEDTKYSRVESILRSYFAEHPTEKVVLFSAFRETLNYLAERLCDSGITGVVMHGGMRSSKEEILEQFRKDESIRLLLSSEVGSEGIDLQFCRVVINYDLPWNPMRIEQRIGRLDRIGQHAKKIVIWNLLHTDTIDERIYCRLYEKLDLCRTALGDLEAVLGDEVGQLTSDLLRDHLTPEQQELRIDQTAQALANMRIEQEKLESEAGQLVAYGDYILNQVYAARDLNRHITGTDLRSYVVDYLRTHHPGSVFQQKCQGALDYNVKLTASLQQQLEDFIRSRRLPPTHLTRAPTKMVACRFENRTGGYEGVGGSTTEIINLFHPLVRFVSTCIQESQTQLTPAVSLKLDLTHVGSLGLELGDYVLAAARWSVEGLQATEKLVFDAASLIPGSSPLAAELSERLANAAAQFGQDWFEAKQELQMERVVSVAAELLEGRLEDGFRDFVDQARRQNEDRIDLQRGNIERHQGSQLRTLHEVLDRHRLRGRESLMKATEGRIRALEERAERQLLRIGSSRNLQYRNQAVLLAIIRIVQHDGPGGDQL